MSASRSERRRVFSGLAFCSPAIVGLLLFMAYPIVASLVFVGFIIVSLMGAVISINDLAI